MQAVYRTVFVQRLLVPILDIHLHVIAAEVFT